MPKMIAKAPTRTCVMARTLTVDAIDLDAGISETETVETQNLRQFRIEVHCNMY